MINIFSRKQIKVNSRRFDRLYRKRLSGFRMEPTRSSSLSEKGKALLASDAKRSAVVVAPKTLVILSLIAGLTAGLVVWQMSRRDTPKAQPSQTDQPKTNISNTVENTVEATNASYRQTATKAESFCADSPSESQLDLENVVVQRFPRSTQNNLQQTVTFQENSVLNSEQEKLSTMDSIKKTALATMMIMALNTTAPAQVDSSTDYQKTETEMATSAHDDPDWRTQFKRHEFTFGVGDPGRANSHRNRIGTEPNYFPEVWLQRQISCGNIYSTCPITLGYRYRVLKWLWVGGDISYCGLYGTFRNLDTDQKVGVYRDHFISIMPAVRFSYLNREHVTLYSGIAGGYALEYGKSYPDYKFHNNHIALNCTLFGVSAGSQRWFGFAEIGWRFKGYANAGFGFRFQSKKNKQ